MSIRFGVSMFQQLFNFDCVSPFYTKRKKHSFSDWLACGQLTHALWMLQSRVSLAWVGRLRGCERAHVLAVRTCKCACVRSNTQRARTRTLKKSARMKAEK